MNMKITTLLILCLLVFTAAPVFAANLFLEASNQNFTQGEEFLASIFLSSPGESINAVEGKILFPENLLEMKEIRDGNSIINFWIEKPKVERPGILIFSGITPGGYEETRGALFSVVFQAKAAGQGNIEFRDVNVLQNDGKGTPASVKVSPFHFAISQEMPGAQSKIENLKDIDPPEIFQPEIAQDSALFAGEWFLVFAAQDKGSGVDRYEVCEGSEKKCVIAESPYVLQNQKLDQKIFVKAVDKSGNERKVSLSPQNFRPWYKDYGILAILMLIGFIASKILLRRFYDKKSRR